ncbi:MAG TPA: hypothetical protein VD903_06570 [Pseudonocardia sp.]|nr:hypothetical protein [Pseudonocardia sp.]
MPALPDVEAFPTQRTDSGHSGPLPVQPPAPPAQRTVVEPCTCGHGRAAHEHYRPGSDCGTCGRAACAEFRPEHGRWRSFKRKLGLLD